MCSQFTGEQSVIELACLRRSGVLVSAECSGRRNNIEFCSGRVPFELGALKEVWRLCCGAALTGFCNGLKFFGYGKRCSRSIYSFAVSGSFQRRPHLRDFAGSGWLHSAGSVLKQFGGTMAGGLRLLWCCLRQAFVFCLCFSVNLSITRRSSSPPSAAGNHFAPLNGSAVIGVRASQH